MTTVDYSRRISSGGAFGYYDGYPIGDLPGTSFTASFASGLHNTWVVSKTIGAGSTVSVIFGQQSANPANAPTPNLFDVSLSFSGSIAVYGVNVGGLSLTSDALSIEILGTTRNYTTESLGVLLTDLLDAGVPQETAENFVATVDAAMGAIAAIEIEALRIYNTINAMDLSTMDDLVSVDLTSSMATASANGTPVNIGEIVHVTATGYADKIKGNASDNIIHGGGGDDWISGGTGADALFGGGADDFIFFDAEDTEVNGGSGRDVAVAVGQTGVAVNMAAQELEVVIGSDGADVISLTGQNTLFAAGGDGSDTFVIGSDAPTVIWGGAGADSFVFADGFASDIAVLSIPGLTERGFASLSLEDLNLGGLNLEAFRTIIINPDSGDRVILGDTTFTTSSLPGGIGWRSFSSPLLNEIVGRPLSVSGGYEMNYEFEATLHVERDEFENVISITDYTGRWLGDGTQEFDFYEYEANSQAEQDEAEAFIQAREDEPVFRMTELETNPYYGPWYGPFAVVGGTFVGGDLVANGQLTASVPNEPTTSPFDWLLAA